MNSTLGSVVPLAMFWGILHLYKTTPFHRIEIPESKFFCQFWRIEETIFSQKMPFSQVEYFWASPSVTIIWHFPCLRNGWPGINSLAFSSFQCQEISFRVWLKGHLMGFSWEEINWLYDDIHNLKAMYLIIWKGYHIPISVHLVRSWNFAEKLHKFVFNIRDLVISYLIYAPLSHIFPQNSLSNDFLGLMSF